MVSIDWTPLRRGFVLGILAVGTLSLGGCGAFFQCEGRTSCGTTGTGTGTGSSGDYAYVSNSTTGSTYLNEYSIGSGALTAISGSPVNLSYVPSAMAVAPGNGYMYIAQLGNGLIYEYAIGSTGALSIANGGQAVASQSTGFSSMDVSSDGNWLFALDNAGLFLYEFPVTKSSGILGSAITFGLNVSGTIVPQSVSVSPNGNYVACALGTAGTIVFPYGSSTGIPVASFAALGTGSTSYGDFGVVMDTNNYLYVARTNGPAVYALTTPSTNTVTATSVTQSSLTNGNGPHPIALSTSAGAALYVGNQTDGTISTYTPTSGVLKNVTTVGTGAPTLISSLARDNSAKYIIAAGYSSTSGVQLFSIGTSGALTSVATAASGTSSSVPALVAVTH